jgi:hypothetical protein
MNTDSTISSLPRVASIAQWNGANPPASRSTSDQTDAAIQSQGVSASLSQAGLDQSVASSTSVDKSRQSLELSSTGLRTISDVLQKMQGLANLAADKNLSSKEAAELNQQFQTLVTQIDETASKVEWDGAGLESSPSAESSDAQTPISGNSSASVSLGLHRADISTPDGALNAATAIKNAMHATSARQATVAAALYSLADGDKTNPANIQSVTKMVSTILIPEATALEVQLKQANAGESMNYYLTNLMGQNAQGVLHILR